MGTKTHLNPPCSDFACVGPLNRLVTGGQRNVLGGREMYWGQSNTEWGTKKWGVAETHNRRERGSGGDTHNFGTDIHTHRGSHRGAPHQITIPHVWLPESIGFSKLTIRFDILFYFFCTKLSYVYTEPEQLFSVTQNKYLKSP